MGMEKNKQRLSNVGESQAENQDELLQSFILKDCCSKLTIGEYIRILCYGEYDKLIIAGKPSDDDLKQCFAGILQEYAFLSGHSNAGGMFMDWETIVLLRVSIVEATMAANFFVFDKDLSIAMLKRSGLLTAHKLENATEEDADKMIGAYIKMLSVRVEDLTTKIAKKAQKQDGKKVQEKDIRTEMAVVGGDGIIPDDCNLATYAAKVNVFRLQQERLKESRAKAKSGRR